MIYRKFIYTIIFLFFSQVLFSQILFDQERVLFDDEIHGPGSVNVLFSADLDGDNDTDILVGTNDKLYWYENNGNGDFSVALTHDIDHYVSGEGAIDSVYAKDLDNDNDLDIIVAREFADDVLWYENDGAGNFGTANLISDIINGPISVISFDVDLDSFNDIVVGLSHDQSVIWYKNNGDGTFQNQNLISSSSDDTAEISGSDLDGDGVLDILIGLEYGALKWKKNNGDGTFGSDMIISQMDEGTAFYASDIDNDGDIDIVSEGSSPTNSIGFYLNDGNGNFGLVNPVDTPIDDSSDIAVNDFDNDGLPDILLISVSNENIKFYKNLGDTNNDGIVEFDTPSVLLQDTFVLPSITVSDFNGNGFIDFVTASASTVELHTNMGAANFTITTIGFTTGGASEIELKDIDLDGDKDILLSTFRRITLLKNDGNGNYGNPITIFSDQDAMDVKPELKTGDFNGDGKVDFATSLGDGLKTFFNDGNGNFDLNQSIFNGRIWDILVDDFTGNGHDDIIINENLTGSNNLITLFENDGSGSFGSGQLISDFTSPYYILSADLDNDGDIDILTDDIGWYENDGNGSFLPFQFIAGGGDIDKSLLTDVDNDGLLDIVSQSSTVEVLVWLRNEGGGVFASSFNLIDTVNSITGIGAGDIDNDGDQDIIVGASVNPGGTESSNSYYLNNGDGTFGQRVLMDVVFGTANERFFALSDINNDAKNDIITSYILPGKISLFLNTSTTTYIPDNNFEQGLIDLGLDDTLDNFVLTDNINTVISLDLSNLNIDNTTGIEAFISLENLDFSQNNISNINLTNNSNLTTINVSNNSITSLNFSGLNYLQSVTVNDNDLTFLNVANGNNLILTQFDSQNNISLDCISVDDNIAATNGTGSYSTWLFDASVSFSLDCSICVSTDVFAITQDINVALNASGNATILPQEVNNGSEDSCGNTPILSLNQDTFNCNNLGENTVILTVTDGNGNVDTATAIVTIEDAMNPTVLGQNIIVDLEGNVSITITPQDVDNGSSDNCDFSLSIDQDTFNEVGIYNINLTATDDSGNFNSTVVEVEVIDSSLSINSFNKKSIILYPNPTNNLIHIYSPFMLEIESIQIYNLSGLKVMEYSESTIRMDVSQLSSGLYFLSMNTSRQTLIRSFIKI